MKIKISCLNWFYLWNRNRKLRALKFMSIPIYLDPSGVPNDSGCDGVTSWYPLEEIYSDSPQMRAMREYQKANADGRAHPTMAGFYDCDAQVSKREEELK